MTDPSPVAPDSPCHTRPLSDVRQLAENGDAGAQLTLGLHYHERRDGQPPDYVQALTWFTRAAMQGNATAQFCLGSMYDKARGVPRDAAAAAHWYRKAADQGFAPAQLNLGIIYDSGDGVPRDPAQAARYYHAAALQGVPAAQYNLGLLYGKGDGVPKDSIEAYAWLSLAAFHEFPNAPAACRAVARTLDADQIADANARAKRYIEGYARHPATQQ